MVIISKREIRKTSIITDQYVCNVFTKVLMKRVENTVDENPPREQAGFKRGYSTTDHVANPNEGEVPIIKYPALCRVRRLRESM